MDFKVQQDRFDNIKWYDSIVTGADRCGSYDFCSVCNKEEPNPCARAAYRYKKKEFTRIATVRIRIGEKE